MRDHVVLFINGQRHQHGYGDAAITLAEFLRQRLRLMGTKIVCNEGDYGACSVLVGRRCSTGRLEYRTVDACITFLFQLDRTHVVTVEGLSRSGELTPLQAAMVHCHGSQCGFCTPGMVTAMDGMIESKRQLDDASLRYGLSGNLCRCPEHAIEFGPFCDLARRERIDLGARAFYATPGIHFDREAGRLLSTSPTTYKIPNATDVLMAFHVDTIENPKHRINVRRSKAVGERPLMLGISVWLAAKQAINQLNPDRLAKLGLPATCKANLTCLTEMTESIAPA